MICTYIICCYVAYMSGGTDEDLPQQEAPRPPSQTPTGVDSWFGGYVAAQDEIGGSQLGGAPFVDTQMSQPEFTTPAPEGSGRPTRQVAPPDPFTYSERQTRAGRRAAGKATKRGRI